MTDQNDMVNGEATIVGTNYDINAAPPKFTPEYKVNHEYVKWLLAQVTCCVQYVTPTTTTIAVAVMPDGYSLGVGKSSCVNPVNYNPIIGEEIAVKQALQKAEDSLWNLLGWELRNYMVEHDLYPKIPKKVDSEISSEYPALIALEEAINTGAGAYTYTQSAYETKLTEVKDTGKQFLGHTIFSEIAGVRFWIFTVHPENTDYPYQLTEVGEPAMYQLHDYLLSISTN